MLLRPRFALLPVLLLAAGSVSAQVISPRPWTDFDSKLAPYTIGGTPVRDVEGTGDASVQTGNSPDKIDIASGNGLANSNCNPASGAGACGTSASVYLGVWNNSTATGDDDYLFFRLRINGDPRASSGFDGYHWNVLLSTDADNYKEFWVDVDGKGAGVDELHIYYENNNSQEISSVATAEVATLDACNTASSTCGGSARPSFTRAVSDPTTGEWFVDIQVPARLLDDNSGSGGNPNDAGSGYAAGTQVVLPSTSIGFLFSTGASSTDPLQKDYSAPCTSPPTGTCSFGDTSTTPVTLSHVRSVEGRDGVELRFGTALEVGHGGFAVEALQQGRWTLVDFAPPADGAIPNQRREYRSMLPKGTRQFRLVEIDAGGTKRLHGPFPVGRTLGDASVAAYRSIDWAAVAYEAKAYAAALQQQNKAMLQSAAKLRPIPTARALVEVEVAQSGLVRIKGSELRAIGIDLAAIDAGAFALTRGNAEVPIYTSRASGNLGDGDYIEFVADFAPTLYSKTATYTLRDDRSRAARVYVRDTAVPAKGSQPEYHVATRSFENNAAYSFSAPVADPFYAARVLALGQPASYSTQVVLDHPYERAGDGSVRITLWGGADFAATPDHHVRVAVNGEAVADRWFDGTTALVLDGVLPAAALSAGVINVGLTLPFDTGQFYDLVNYDKLEVTYPRKLYAESGALDFRLAADIVVVRDVGDSDASAYAVENGKITRLRAESVCVRYLLEGCSVRFAGHGVSTRYMVASARAMSANRSLRAAAADADLFSGPAELLVLAHGQFMAQAQQLAAVRRAEGLSADVVDVAQVYRQIGTGSPDAAALRDYLAMAMARRGTRYVLLFGGDSYDYHNNLGLQTISHVPSAYVAFDSISRFVPSDADLADLDRDGQSDLAIGRLPARTTAEAEAMLAKILRYQSTPRAARAVLLADRGYFVDRSIALLSAFPADVSVQMLKLDDATTPSIVRSQLLAAITDGVDVVHYHGHSAPERWSFDNILSTSHVSQIQSAVPFIADQLGCWNNYYVDPLSDSLARAMLADADAAVASIGPTALADEFREEAFANFLIPLLHRPTTRLGDAIWAAKDKQRSSGLVGADIQLGINLLGDPSMPIH